MARRILFRLELGGATGWGHLARCAALAEEMKRRGWECHLWTDSDASAAPDDLRVPFREIVPAGPAWCARPPVAHAIVVDWYGATDDGLRELRGAAPRSTLLVIDDEAQRILEVADLVLNSRLGLIQSPYAPAARALLGESYALLRAGLRQPAAIASPFAPGVEPILIMMGGTDPRGLTAQVVHALADVGARGFAPVVLVGRSGQDELASALERFPAHQRLERVDAPTLAGWAKICRGAISACGGTLYELAALGLPFIGVVVAENQRAFAGEVAQRWGMAIVDGTADVREAVASALPRLITDPKLRVAFARIDGRGAVRVADAIEDR